MPPITNHESRITDQLDLFQGGVTQADTAELVALLRRHGWMHRRQIAPLTGWSERKIRAVAEALPREIIRGQRGYAVIDRVEPQVIKRCADAMRSQGTRMLRVALVWTRIAHQRLG